MSFLQLSLKVLIEKLQATLDKAGCEEVSYDHCKSLLTR